MTPEVIPIFFKNKAIMGVKHSQGYVIAFSPVLLAFHSLILNHLQASFSEWAELLSQPFDSLHLSSYVSHTCLNLQLYWWAPNSSLLSFRSFSSFSWQHNTTHLLFVQMIPSYFVLLASTLQTNKKSGSFLRFHTHLIMMILYPKYLSCH